MILKKISEQNNELIISVYYIEKNFEGENNTFCGNGARAISHYLHQYYNYQKYYLQFNRLYLSLVKDKNQYGVGLPQKFLYDSKKLFCLQEASQFYEKKI